MLDSQKISFDKWVVGYKHGVYVFSTDSCQICKDYRQSIAHINNCFLYFVEVNTEDQKKVFYELTKRRAFPVTIGYFQNKIEFIEMGMLFDTQMEVVLKYLKKFGDKPLSSKDIEELTRKEEEKCYFTLYAFTDDFSPEEKEKVMSEAISHYEIPFDIDNTHSIIEEKWLNALDTLNATRMVTISKKSNPNGKLSFIGQQVLFSYSTKMNFDTDMRLEDRSV